MELTPGVYTSGDTDPSDANIALYSVNRLVAVLNNQLAIIDSRLNVEFISNSNTVHAETLHYRMDKRELMAYSGEMNSVLIHTLQYEGEDLSTDHVCSVYE